MNVPLYVTSFAWVMNKNTYASMSPAQQKVIDEHCTNAWALRIAAPWADFERAGIAKLASDPAHEVYGITDAQLDAWKRASEPVVAAWADGVRKVGADPDAVLRELKQTLAEFHAAY
jgi:TRAP-type C4-dicarboxylate transport system substrate-binding protein